MSKMPCLPRMIRTDVIQTDGIYFVIVIRTHVIQTDRMYFVICKFSNLYNSLTDEIIDYNWLYLYHWLELRVGIILDCFCTSKVYILDKSED